MITLYDGALKDIERRLSAYPKKVPTVLNRALNRAAATVKTQASKHAREIYRVKAKDVNSTFSLKKSTTGSLSAIVVSRSGSMGLEKFRINASPGKSKPKAFRAAVKKSGSLKEIVRAFAVDVNGTKVFQREGDARLPIKRLFGPPVPQMVNNPELRKHVEQQASETFEKRLEHEIKRVLEGN